MINGQSVQLGRIRDLFHSVQLDVNNPHFRVMQERITDVINMEPADIMAMIRKTAGTKMYELKKVKVYEIQYNLEISPQPEKLRHEKTHCLQWIKNNQEIDKLERLMTVNKFHGSKMRVNQGNEELAALKNEIHESVPHTQREGIGGEAQGGASSGTRRCRSATTDHGGT